MEKTVCIVAGGPRDLIPDLFDFHHSNAVWIGVDKGVQYILDAGLLPHCAVGDFDSITDAEWLKVDQTVPAIERHQPEKDETDMELALLWALRFEPEQILVFGGTGGRLDHFMANALMLVPIQTNHPSLSIHLIDIHNEVSIQLPGEKQLQRVEEKKYVSFIPLSQEVTGLTLRGFKYPLKDKRVPFGSSLCISNELAQQTGTFSFEKGIVMMIRSSD